MNFQNSTCIDKNTIRILFWEWPLYDLQNSDDGNIF